MIVGVTGNFGAGKTTVACMFRELGAKLIDADKIAHQLIRSQSKIYKQILACFGRGILAPGNRFISRKKLAGIVFGSPRALKRLNAIMHPAIIRIIENRINKSHAGKILIIDAALLIETGFLSRVDKLVVVKSLSRIQMQRLITSGLTADQIKQRLLAQLPQSRKIVFADFVVNNSGTRAKTRKQVRDIWNKLSDPAPF
ncbi:MAG: dephospho-CoA kinase [Candidatus Omnitrophota bacterium]